MTLTCISVLLLASFRPVEYQDNQGSPRKLKTIVLDPGHGGHDSGAVGRQSKEKDIALQVALKLGKKIEREFPGIKVIYTRTTDVYPKLYERPALANKHHADLFISIHCNSGGASSRRVKNSRGKYVTQRVLNTSAKGTETLVLGFSRTGDQDVAIRENASILMEDNYKENYGGFDPKDPSTYIVFSLMKRKFREQSIRLASYMQDQFQNSSRTDRGVKEQSLAVLATAGMPAVLTEIGFISNPDEERFMMSSAGQESIVTDLFNAINTYRKSIEK
ncbi:N-acetylmuramoyl-L-alanine amidase family protein [Sphingobacterium endophyticum]|uniref:N-acetylmuramoyl-L-alanine amidase family protein n=1 Tax=Sphingobacterium endophyticum TaxID=2546448 RepID=UPI0012E22A16